VWCTFLSVAFGVLLGVPYGAWLGLYRPRWHAQQAFLLRVGMFVPTVALGLVVYGLLTWRGPLGPLDLLFSKTAVVFGQTLLAFPLLATLAHGAAAGLPPVVAETARTLGAGRWRAMLTALGEVRHSLGAAVLLASARCITELGIATTVGGNLEMRTRTLPGIAQLELSKGNFARAMAPTLVLVLIAVGLAVLAFRLERGRRPR
jgi:tungstate transport system permease protein